MTCWNVWLLRPSRALCPSWVHEKRNLAAVRRRSCSLQVASQLPLTQQSGVRAASVQTKAVSTYSAPGTVTSSVLPVGPPIQLASSVKQLSPEEQRLRLENAYQIEAPSLEEIGRAHV